MIRSTLIAIVSALGVTSVSQADSVVLQPRVSAGTQDYQLHFDDVILPLPNGGHDFRGGFKVDDRLPFFGAGMSLVAGQFFIDLAGQWSQHGQDHNQQFENVAIGPGSYTNGDGQNHDSLVKFDRREFNLSVGWGFTPNFSAYAGYKHAKANLTQTLTPILSPPPLLIAGADGDVLFYGDYKMDFTYKGAFVGATYSVPVSAGALSFQSSLARLDGSFTQNFLGNVFVTNPGFANSRRAIDPAFKDGSISGQSFGLNVGISWTGNFAWINEGLSRLNYTLGVDHSQYKFDSGNSSSIWAADMEERNTRGRAELRYRFGGAR